jgi:hypothetical protein
VRVATGVVSVIPCRRVHPSASVNQYRNIPLEIQCSEMGISKPMKPMTLHSRLLLPMRKSFLAVILITTLGLLSACGGSGSGSAGDPPPASLTISTSSLPTGQTGVAYSAVLAATGALHRTCGP